MKFRMNWKLFLLDTAENAGAIVKKTRKPPSNTYPWFDRECMSEKQIYRTRAAYAVKESAYVFFLLTRFRSNRMNSL